MTRRKDSFLKLLTPAEIRYLEWLVSIDTDPPKGVHCTTKLNLAAKGLIELTGPPLYSDFGYGDAKPTIEGMKILRWYHEEELLALEKRKQEIAKWREKWQLLCDRVEASTGAKIDLLRKF